MAHYRKKPVVIEAVQVKAARFDPALWPSFAAFKGFPFSEAVDWLRQAIADRVVIPRAVEGQDIAEWQIRTLEGMMTAQPGDWIIRGVKGELYPCKPDIFEATYESPNVAGPVLMSPEHPAGWKLEDLLAQVCVEVRQKCAKIADKTETDPVALRIYSNNLHIITHLGNAEIVQRESYNLLHESKGKNEGPTGKPRI